MSDQVWYVGRMTREQAEQYLEEHSTETVFVGTLQALGERS